MYLQRFMAASNNSFLPSLNLPLSGVAYRQNCATLLFCIPFMLAFFFFFNIPCVLSLTVTLLSFSYAHKIFMFIANSFSFILRYTLSFQLAPFSFHSLKNEWPSKGGCVFTGSLASSSTLSNSCPYSFFVHSPRLLYLLPLLSHHFLLLHLLTSHRACLSHILALHPVPRVKYGLCLIFLSILHFFISAITSQFHLSSKVKNIA